MNFFSSVDYFGFNPTLYIKSKSKLQTTFGGLLTLAAIILTILGSYYFGQEVWEKKSPIVNTSRETTIEPKDLVLDKEKWDIFFGLQFKNILYEDPTIYKVEATTMQLTDNGFKFIKLDTERCTKDSFSPEIYDLFKNLNINGTCFKKNNSEVKVISKLWGQKDFKAIQILIKPCTNSTSSDNYEPICASPQEIELKLAATTFSIYMIDNYLYSSNFTNPLTKYVYNDFMNLGKGSFTGLNLILYHRIISSDIGFLFKTYEQIETFGIDKLKTSYIPNPDIDGTFLRLRIQLSSMKEIVTRKYLKIQELVAQIGGVANLMIISANILIFFHNSLCYKLYLVNYAFDYYSDSQIKHIQQIKNIVNSPLLSNIQTSKFLNIKNNGFTSRVYKKIKFNFKLQSPKNHNEEISKKGEINYDKNESEISKIMESANNVDLHTIKNLSSSIKINFRNDKQELNNKKINFSLKELILNFLFCCSSKKKSYLDKCFDLLKKHFSVEAIIDFERFFKKTIYFEMSEKESLLFSKIPRQNNIIMFGNNEDLDFHQKYLKDMYKYVD